MFSTHTHTHAHKDVSVLFAMCSVRERVGVARSTRLCADSGNRVGMAAAAAWQLRRKEWSNAKKIPPERCVEGRKGGRQGGIVRSKQGEGLKADRWFRSKQSIGSSKNKKKKKKAYKKQFKLLGNDMDAKKWWAAGGGRCFTRLTGVMRKRERCSQSVGAHVCHLSSCRPSIW